MYLQAQNLVKDQTTEKRPAQANYASQQPGHLEPTKIVIENRKLAINIHNMKLTEAKQKIVNTKQ